jgi:hypothetical protein
VQRDTCCTLLICIFLTPLTGLHHCRIAQAKLIGGGYALGDRVNTSIPALKAATAAHEHSIRHRKAHDSLSSLSSGFGRGSRLAGDGAHDGHLNTSKEFQEYMNETDKEHPNFLLPYNRTHVPRIPNFGNPAPRKLAAATSLERFHMAHAQLARSSGNHTHNNQVGEIHVHGAGMHPEQVANLTRQELEKHHARVARGHRLALTDHLG